MTRAGCLVPIACMATPTGKCRVCGQHARRAREFQERQAAAPAVAVPAWVARAGLSERYIAEARARGEEEAASVCRAIKRETRPSDVAVAACCALAVLAFGLSRGDPVLAALGSTAVFCGSVGDGTNTGQPS